MATKLLKRPTPPKRTVPKRAPKATSSKYEILGVTKDGVKILKPKDSADHVSVKEAMAIAARVVAARKARGG